MLHSPRLFDASRPPGHDGVFDWDWLAGAFGDTITPMDLDFLVERRGRFLVIETKRPEVEVPAGQARALRRLSAIPGFTVVVAWGKSAREITRFEVWRGEATTSYRDDGGTRLRAFCETWYAHANEE